jgi:hypothetical protein
VQIASLKDGKLLGSWSKEGLSESIGLSPDGNLLAVALTFNEQQLSHEGFVPVRDNNVLIVKAESGEVVRTLNTGVVAGDAQFLAGSKELVTVSYDHGSEDAQWYLRCMVKLWNLETGRLERELGYPRY